ncbi:tetratricopeptide repeat protein [Geothrix sp. SG200]|uniref:tetratricopeptide repeat protein n=1 Tax=Geothrix sp. SG200 TaxID=2922865 RepID=UPI001FADA0B3|nr:tetratricopeptide repeat protein [Geothrix sp. SG200]
MNSEHMKTALPILLLVSLLLLLGWSILFGFYLNRIGSQGRASVFRLLRTFRWAGPLTVLISAILLHGPLAWAFAEATFGKAEAQRALAMDYFSGRGLLPQDRIQARAWLTRAASQGDREAEFTLAQMWYGGTGGPSDPIAALRWARAAAAQGHPLAMLLVGEILTVRPGLAEPGESAQQTYAQARTFIQREAQLGNTNAIFAFGRMLSEGLGGSADPVEGYRWLLKAKAQGLDPFQQIYVQSMGQRLNQQQRRAVMERQD